MDYVFTSIHFHRIINLIQINVCGILIDTSKTVIKHVLLLCCCIIIVSTYPFTLSDDAKS